MDQVRLPDLEVIKRFSIAVRREHAPVEDVVAALEADLAAIRAATGRARPANARPASSPARPARTTKTTTSRSSASRSTPSRGRGRR